MAEFPKTANRETSDRDIEDRLRAVAGVRDEEVDLAEAALLFAALDRPLVDLDRYRDHLRQIAAAVGEDFERRLASNPGARNPEDKALTARVDALTAVIAGRYGYTGDERSYDDPQNANLIRVIDRRRGLPVTLGILFLNAARHLGWDMVGLSFPGHFLVRLEAAGRRAVLDPFDRGAAVGTPGLRRLLKTNAGEAAELTPDHYRPVGNRDVLLRLQNNLKLRALREGRVEDALRTVERMLLVAPGQESLWREAGLMQARLGRLKAAIALLEEFMARAGNDTARYRTSLLLQDLRARLT